jgi:CMP-N-acetylneuraminic acid synthetase/mannose-6-phosphate isomerase-like protein (cupin superfamily)
VKTAAVIPLLSGSTRVPFKNEILLDGYPALHYSLIAANESGAFDQVFVHTDYLQYRELVEAHGAVFMERFPHRGGNACTMANSSADCAGGRCQVHDHFLYDFMERVEATHVFQLHTTSPLLSPPTIQRFVDRMLSSGCDSQFAVTSATIETMVGGSPVNFDPARKQPTQDLPRTSTISWAIAGWRRSAYMEAYANGPTFCGQVLFHDIPKEDAIEIDDPEDVFIVEACLAHRKSREDVGRFRYNPDAISGIESDLPALIARDGSPLTPPPADPKHVPRSYVLKALANTSGTVPVVLSDKDQVGMIFQKEGEGCRRHCHVSKAEFWFIVDGQFRYDLWPYPEEGPVEGDPTEVIVADKGDIVFLPKGTVHRITCTSPSGTRMACGGRDMAHIYV